LFFRAKENTVSRSAIDLLALGLLSSAFDLLALGLLSLLGLFVWKTILFKAISPGKHGYKDYFSKKT
jgi:hypothetical protein